MLGGLLAAFLLGKYQAVYLIAPVAAIVGTRWLIRLGQALRARGNPAPIPVRPLLAVAGALLGSLVVLSSPHFLKNAIFYKNPVYPFMQRVFTATTPTVPDAAFHFENVFTDINWVPQGHLFQRLWHAVRISQTFSFVPHYSFTKEFPAYGSLFTLLLVAIPFVAHRNRKLLGAGLGLGGLLVWGYTFNVDRNLQVLTPILAAVTAALLVDGFRASRIAAIGLVPLLAMQIVWGGDAFFYSSYARIQSATELIRSGFDGRAATRFDQYRASFLSLRAAIPKKATVLLHSSHEHLGIDRRLYLDWTGFQGLISYAGLKTPRELYDHYRKLGVTHVIYIAGEHPGASCQEDVLFHTFARRHQSAQTMHGWHRLLPLPKEAPAPEAPFRVGAIGLAGYGSGIFAVERMNTNTWLLDPAKRRYNPPDAPLPKDSKEAQTTRLDAFLVGEGTAIPPSLVALIARDFSQEVGYAGHYTLYLRK